MKLKRAARWLPVLVLALSIIACEVSGLQSSGTQRLFGGLIGLFAFFFIVVGAVAVIGGGGGGRGGGIYRC